MIDLTQVGFSQTIDEKRNVGEMRCELTIGAEISYDLSEADNVREFTKHIKKKLVENIHFKLYREILEACSELRRAVFYLEHQIMPRPEMDALKERIEFLHAMILKEMPDSDKIRNKPISELPELPSNTVQIRVVVTRENSKQGGIFFYRDGIGDDMVDSAADYFENVFTAASHELVKKLGGNWVGTPPENPIDPGQQT